MSVAKLWLNDSRDAALRRASSVIRGTA